MIPEETCPTCHGVGQRPGIDGPCHTCGGAGYIVEGSAAVVVVVVAMVMVYAALALFVWMMVR